MAQNKVTLHLVDPARGRPVQTWRFKGQALITIGRSEQTDVSLGDPYVSRHHAELRFENDRWFVVNVGRHGILIQGEKVDRAPLQDGAVFQLGSTGPSLRFHLSYTAPELDTTSIVTAMKDLGDVLQIDEALTEQQVEEIAETPYFQRLKEFTENRGLGPAKKSKAAGE